MDKKKLVLGDDWEHKIKNTVAKSDAFLVCLRPGFNETGFRQREVRWAREAWELRPPGKGFIIPFIVQPCQLSDLPEWCTPIHAGSDLAARTNFDEVLKALEKHQSWTGTPRRARTKTHNRRGEAASKTPVPAATKYTDGDWITAAIVARERAETDLKKVASRVGKSATTSRLAEPDRSVIERDTIVTLLQTRIQELLEKHARGGTTDDARLEACIAKVVANILESELAEFEWAADERSNDNCVLVFRDTIKTLGTRHR